MNNIAKELNEKISNDNQNIYELLSDIGKKIYFPRGILFQSAEAKKKAHKFNATIGIATENKTPMYLQEIYNYFNNLEPSELFSYAPASGKPNLRELWKEKMFGDNPNLKNKLISMPIVTNAITHGLSISADLFVNNGDNVVIPNKLWGNYKLIFGLRRGANIVYYPFFKDDGFNLDGLNNTLNSIKEDKIIIIFNFPNNPAGYSITKKEGQDIVSLLTEIADNGKKLVVISDDAYFGLFYEEEVLKESIFSSLSNIHEKILAIKLDGVTKEEFLWGFRIGFITYSAKYLTKESYNALEQKTMGIIRGTISNCSMPAQSILEKVISVNKYKTEQMNKFDILKRRYKRVKEVLKNQKYNEVWELYPFNSGYFMCLKLKSIDAELFRTTLLEKYGIGVIATDKKDIRVAFSCIEEKFIDEVFETLYKCAKELSS
ncbi:MAG: aminotransferase class I/II-fold pyridoxal phosphate-dependent enzyme [Candidatus Helarchaeota archaeon]